MFSCGYIQSYTLQTQLLKQSCRGRRVHVFQLRFWLRSRSSDAGIITVKSFHKSFVLCRYKNSAQYSKNQDAYHEDKYS